MTQQTALVTGASEGFGYALAGVFASKGYNIVAVGHHAEKLEIAAEIFRMRGVNVISLVKDLTQPEAPRQIYDELNQLDIVVDVLVNNACTSQSGPFHIGNLDKNLAIIRLNVEALTRMTALFVTGMVARGNGKILNMGSVTGCRPGPQQAVYHATEAYVVSFSEAIAEELKDTGVSVTVLCPGPANSAVMDSADGANGSSGAEHGNTLDAADVARAGFEALMDGERILIPGTGNGATSAECNNCR